MATNYMTVDASAMASFNYDTFLADYYAPTTATNGAATWLDAKALSFMGMPFYYPADEASIRFGADNDRGIILEGEDMGYDVAGFHTYYGTATSIRFGYYNEGTVYAEGNGERSEMVGVIEGVVISGLEIAVPKATNEAEAEDLASNAFYDLYNWLRHANGTLTDDVYIDELYNLFASKAQHFVGSAGDDTYAGTKFADKIDGGAGFDTLSGGNGKDVFVFDLGDSAATVDTADIILDFQLKKDVIDLSAIDTNATKAGDQAFKFFGTGDLGSKAGVAFEKVGSQTHVSIDSDGDAVADMLIVLEGNFKLTVDHFIL